MRWSQELESTHVLLSNTSTLAEIQYIPCFTYVFIILYVLQLISLVGFFGRF